MHFSVDLVEPEQAYAAAYVSTEVFFSTIYIQVSKESEKSKSSAFENLKTKDQNLILNPEPRYLKVY